MTETIGVEEIAYQLDVGSILPWKQSPWRTNMFRKINMECFSEWSKNPSPMCDWTVPEHWIMQYVDFTARHAKK